MSRIKAFILAAVILGLAPALASAQAGTAPLAEEQLGGTVLTVVPRIAYERAMLRVSGPDGYALTERFESGAPFSVDLEAAAERAVPDGQENRNAEPRADRPALPDGSYSYEVVFLDRTGASQVHRGALFLESGQLSSPGWKSAEPQHPGQEPSTGGLASEGGRTPQDLTDPGDIKAGSGLAAGNTGRSPADGELELDFNGISSVERHFGGLALEAVDNNAAIWIGDNGRVGIGTTAPARKLDVVDASGIQLRLGDQGFGVFEFNVGLVGLWFFDREFDSVLKLNHSAGSNALVVDGAGIGLGTAEPGFRLDLRGSTPTDKIFVGNSATPAQRRFLLELRNNGPSGFLLTNNDNGQQWSFSQLPGGSFEITRVGGGGATMRVDPNGNLFILGSLFQNSSREVKTGFEAVDNAEVLRRVVDLPIQQWRYASDAAGVRHLGPVAEDFHARFGLGGTSSAIAVGDTSGVALAAIQGLHAEAVAKERRIAELERRNTELGERLRALEQAVQRLTAPLSLQSARSVQLGPILAAHGAGGGVPRPLEGERPRE